MKLLLRLPTAKGLTAVHAWYDGITTLVCVADSYTCETGDIMLLPATVSPAGIDDGERSWDMSGVRWVAVG